MTIVNPVLDTVVISIIVGHHQGQVLDPAIHATGTRRSLYLGPNSSTLDVRGYIVLQEVIGVHPADMVVLPVYGSIATG